MTSDTRNTMVVVSLILAMTAGARLLLWLEPGPGKGHATPTLTAISGIPIEDVLVEYVPVGNVRSVGVDCHLLPDGQLVGRLDDPHIHLAVIGTDADELTEQQQNTLLRTLGSMTRGRHGELIRVKLALQPDAGKDTAVPPQARNLRELLVRKKIIE